MFGYYIFTYVVDFVHNFDELNSLGPQGVSQIRKKKRMAPELLELLESEWGCW